MTRDDANTSTTQVTFSWTEPSNTGGAPILDYTVLMDLGQGYDNVK